MLDTEAGDIVHKLAKDILDHWPQILFLAGATMGALLWGAKQFIGRFSLRSEMEEYAEINTQQHDDIKASLGHLRQDMNDKHHEILHTILSLHKKDHE